MYLKKYVAKILGPEPKFKKGDSVQCFAHNDLMVVQWGKVLHRRQVVYLCSWYDAKTGTRRTNLFKEEALAHFDWYGAVS